MAEVTGAVVTEESIQGSTPRGFLSSLGDVAINGLNAFIDLELADRLGQIPSTQADVLAQQQQADQSQPQRNAVVDFLSTGPGLAVALLGLVGGAVLLSRVL